MKESLPEAYRKTVFVVPAPADPLPRQFAVVTAWNPMDQTKSLEWNQEANTRLHQLIIPIDAHPFEVIGCSPDLSHREPGWGFRASLEEARLIARRFDQRALWWIEDDRLHLCACGHSETQSLGRFSERIIQEESPTFD